MALMANDRTPVSAVAAQPQASEEDGKCGLGLVGSGACVLYMSSFDDGPTLPVS
jgi:hypothetical protein